MTEEMDGCAGELEKKSGHLEPFLQSEAEMERVKDVVSKEGRSMNILKLHKLIDILGEGGICKNTK